MTDPNRNRTSADQRLLVVDDEPDLRTLYELTLLREGYRIETAGSVEEALACLAGATYDVVITDMRLPDGSGLDLLHVLEEGGRSEKAIVITAYGSAENAVEALKAGAYDYLTKPVDLKQFRSVVASALGRPGAAPAAPGALAGAVVGAAAPAGARRASGRPGAPAAPAAEGLDAEPVMARIAGRSAAMQQVRALIRKVSRSMAPVLVSGESGTGKELVARAIHGVSGRSAQPFVAVNCGAIPEQLLEAEFFGYRKGAFTGATEDRAGFFQAANGGTLFLDEIGDLPLAMQSKLLRAVQERAVRPIGAVGELQIDVRLLSATHKDLAAEVLAGRFRQDLYYRLNVIQIRVPPLRERIEDLPDIVARVLDRIAADAGRPRPPRLGPGALAVLEAHPFPGNVRELENLLHRVVALADGEVIDAADLGLSDDATGFAPTQRDDLTDEELALLGPPVPALPPVPVLPPVPTAAPAPAPAAAPPAAPDTPLSWPGLPGVPGAGGESGVSSGTVGAAAAAGEAPLPSDLEAYLDAVERDILIRALERHRYNRTAAGASLGLSLRQMRYRMARLQVGVGDDGEGRG